MQRFLKSLLSVLLFDDGARFVVGKSRGEGLENLHARSIPLTPWTS